MFDKKNLPFDITPYQPNDLRFLRGGTRFASVLAFGFLVGATLKVSEILNSFPDTPSQKFGELALMGLGVAVSILAEREYKSEISQIESSLPVSSFIVSLG